MAIPAGLRALGHRDFRLFWCGQLVSLIGTWMQSVGQAWLVPVSPPLSLLLPVSSKRRLLLGTPPRALQASLAVLVRSPQFWHAAVLAAPTASPSR
jgi:hypothetical protein